MNKNEARQELIKFLKQHKALKGYVRGFVLTYGDNAKLKWFFRKCEPRYWFEDCFVWEGTKEKHHFWSYLDKEWQDKLNE